MANLRQSISKNKSKVIALKGVQPVKVIKPKRFECAPYGQALRESLTTLIEKHKPDSLSNILSNLLIWSVGNSFETKDCTSFIPGNMGLINSFYTEIKYLIWTIDCIEKGEASRIDYQNSVDFKTFIALKKFLSYLATTYNQGVSPNEKLRLIIDIIDVYNNYHIRAIEIEKRQKRTSASN